MNPTTVMVQGTTSDAGKSTVVAGICRVLRRRGLRVAPFKPQNMALNSAVTEDGGEIGRAQSVQAQACGLEPHSDMNPVLIKPSSDTGAQIIVQGQVQQDMDAQSFHRYKKDVFARVLESHARLEANYEKVVVEGAGSPAEINLREGDIANMGFAEAVDCPVILVADIDKGGVFAHLVGTLDLLSESERRRVVGFVINKFRGDLALLTPGLTWLEAHTGKPVLGVLPYLHNFYLEAEDAIDIRGTENATTSMGSTNEKKSQPLRIVVPVLPRISNHTDFDVLRLHPNIELTFVGAGQEPPSTDLIILPGSKNVRDDLTWLIENGWQAHLDRHLRYGGKVIGICGGYQMLGQAIYDPAGVEGRAGKTTAFGYLPVKTTYAQEKTLIKKEGVLVGKNGEKFCLSGYEIHHGKTEYLGDTNNPFTIQYSSGDSDGMMSDDRQVFGCYLHGLFDEPQALNFFLRWGGLKEENIYESNVDIQQMREQEIDRLADEIERHLDLRLLDKSALESQVAGV